MTLRLGPLTLCRSPGDTHPFRPLPLDPLHPKTEEYRDLKWKVETSYSFTSLLETLGKVEMQMNLKINKTMEKSTLHMFRDQNYIKDVYLIVNS